MSLKKALAIMGLIFVLVLVSLFLLSMWNVTAPLVAMPIQFLTVDMWALLASKLEWVVLTIGGIGATIAGAFKTVGNVKKTATAQVTQAQEKASVANSNVNTLLTENQKLVTETIPQKDAQITDLNSKLETATLSSQESTQKIAEQELLIASLRGQLQGTRDTNALGIAYANDPRVVEAVTPKVT